MKVNLPRTAAALEPNRWLATPSQTRLKEVKVRTLFMILPLLIPIMFGGCSQAQILATQTPTLLPTSTLTPTPTPTLTATVPPTPTATNILSPTSIPSLPPGVENVVQVYFNNSFFYYASGTTFVNHEVDGFGHWDTHLENVPDSSHAPVYGLELDFLSEIDQIENVRNEYLESFSSHTYHWFFNDVPEEPIRDVYKAEAYIEPRSITMKFTPGFDASISMDKTSFISPDHQKVTLTLIPRQNLSYPSIIIHLQGGHYGNSANVEVVDFLTGETRGRQGELVLISPDKKNISITDLPLSIDVPYVFDMTVKVDPKGNKTRYQPYVGFIWCPDGSINGTIKGDTVSWHIEQVGNWKWKANGEYIWNWGAGTVYTVSFNG